MAKTSTKLELNLDAAIDKNKKEQPKNEAKVEQSKDKVEKPKRKVKFIYKKYPSAIVTYMDGNKRKSIRFKDGVFETSDETQIKVLEAHKNIKKA